MASKVGSRPKRGCKSAVSNGEPIRQKPERKQKAPQRRQKEAKTLDNPQPTEPPSKRVRKVLNKKEREDLSNYLEPVEEDVLIFTARSKLSEQIFPDSTKVFIEVLFKNEQLLQDIVIHHRC